MTRLISRDGINDVLTAVASVLGRRTLLACNSQLVASDFFGVTNKKPAVCDDWVIPGLTFDRLKSTELAVFARVRGDKHGAALIRDNYEQRLVTDQKHLAAAVAAVAPKSATGLQIDASKNPAVEAVNGFFQNDEIVEGRLQLPGDPAFRRFPRCV